MALAAVASGGICPRWSIGSYPVLTNRADMIPTNRLSFRPKPADILGLPAGECDPVQIILAAQLRLRNCRRDGDSLRGRVGGGEIRRIVDARDTLLREAIAALARRGLRSMARATRGVL